MKKALMIFLILCALQINCTVSFAKDDIQIPVLLYHNVTTEEIPNGELMHISPQLLEEHFKAISEEGYTAISYEEYYAYRTQGAALPDKPIMISFDDGYESNYLYAYPLLQKYNMKATIFVITSRVGAQNVPYPHFTWDEAKEMENSGIVEIESHSNTHPDFSTLNLMQTVLELRLSKYQIETNMNKECKFFVYPYGKTNSYATAVAASAGYKLVSIVGNDGAIQADTDAYHLPRHTISGKISGTALIEYINSIH